MTSFTPLRLDQVLDVFLPIERREIVDPFSGADKSRGDSKLILNRDDDPAFAAAIEFGDDEACQCQGIEKFAGVTECYTPSGCIPHALSPLGRVRIECGFC